MNKICRNCKKEKDSNDFLQWKNKHFSYLCKECYKKMQRPLYAQAIKKRYGNKLKKYDNIDEKSLSYTAGLIDGEGCIFISRGKPRGKRKTPEYCLVVSIGMSTDIALKDIIKTFGGTMIKRPNGNFKPIYQWRIQAIKAEGFLRCILPYLKIKYKEAKLGLQFREHIINYMYQNGKTITNLNEIAAREAYKLKMEELKRCV